MLKTSWKFLRTGLSVDVMDKVEQFRLTDNCIGDKLSITKAVSVYPFRETILSMISNTLP